MGKARADTMNRFDKLYENGFYLTTNAFRFGTRDASPPDSFIWMDTEQGKLVMRYKRNAQFKTDHWGNSTNDFAAAFICGGVGAFNGRECSYEHEIAKLPGGVKREYDYEARDLIAVRKRVGLPVYAKSFPELFVRAKIESDFFGHSAAYDMYWHHTDKGFVSGHKDTINAMYGSKTKAYNVIYWIHAPSNNNAGIELANGWSGAAKIAERNIGGRNVQVALKQEKANNNNFLQIALIGEDTKEIEIPAHEINEWLMRDAWDTINRSSVGQTIMRQMGDQAPIQPHGRMAFGGGTLGNEVWFSDPDDSETEIVWDRFEFEVNGVVYTPWLEPSMSENLKEEIDLGLSDDPRAIVEDPNVVASRPPAPGAGNPVATISGTIASYSADRKELTIDSSKLAGHTVKFL